MRGSLDVEQQMKHTKLMKIQPCLLCETVQPAIDDHVLILNSAQDPFPKLAGQQIPRGKLLLAEDNIAALSQFEQSREQNSPGAYRHIPFHEYTLHEAPATIDVAAMNILYQPGNTWINYGLQLAMYALKPAGHLYVTGAKDRGILSVAKRMQEYFGNVETLTISKGQRVFCSRKDETLTNKEAQFVTPLVSSFADGNLDEGTHMLLEALEVHTTDVALDIGCGAGFIGLHIARLASKGQVTMVDASLTAVDVARRKVEQSGLTNVQILASDGTQAVQSQRFDLVVTNPPFHLGGVQTTATAERFIREAAPVLRPRGRFYMVANRFLKYEPTLRACFKTVEEVSGDKRYKVLRGLI
jgi:16S rRNA (guanine1207-N2)-methyltransferase